MFVSPPNSLVEILTPCDGVRMWGLWEVIRVFSSVTQWCPTLCNPRNHSTPGFPVFHCLLEFVQAHIHWVSDAIQPPHLLSSPSPPAFNLFPASGCFPMSWLFESGGQSTGASVSVLSMNIQGWFPLGLIGLISLQFKGSRVFSSSTIWKHQFFSTQPNLWSNSYICTWLLEKPSLWLDGPLLAK